MTIIKLHSKADAKLPAEEQQQKLRNLIGGTGTWNPNNQTVKDGQCFIKTRGKTRLAIPGKEFKIIGLAIKATKLFVLAKDNKGSFLIKWQFALRLISYSMALGLS